MGHCYNRRIMKNIGAPKKFFSPSPRRLIHRTPSTIRTRFLIVVALSLLPSLVVAVATGYQLAVAVFRTSQVEAARSVEGIAAHHRLIIEGTEQMLRTIAASKVVRSGDIEGMREFFTQLVRSNHQYATILATDAMGMVVASGIQIAPYALSDRAYLAEALARKNTVVGPYSRSRATGLPIIPIALPVLDQEGKASFVLIASLRVDVLKESLTRLDLSENVIVELLDRNGDRVYRIPTDPAFPPGQRGDQELISLLDTSTRSTPFSYAYRGRRVFVRSARIDLGVDRESRFRVILAVPVSVSNGTTQEILLPYITVGILSILLSIALAAWFYTRSIGRRMGAIAEVAGEIGFENGASIRPPLDGEDELDLLRRTLIDSADALRRREKERKEASEVIEASLREKEALLKEIHHRVKNNFQVISSLLNLQAMSITDESILMMFEESRNRILSMALIHERLYRSDNFSSIDFGDYARSMADQIETTYRNASERIVVRVKAGQAPLLLDAAVPLGLVLNELLSNCFKHAYPHGTRGSVLVELSQDCERHGLFSVEDDGVGLPGNFEARRSGSLGLELVSTLAGQLRGTLTVASPPPGKLRGTRFTVSFPLPEGMDWKEEQEEAMIDG